MEDIIELKPIGNNQYIYRPLYVNLVSNCCPLEERDKLIDDIAHYMVDKLKHFKLVSYDYQIVPDIEYEGLLRLLFDFVIEEKENKL